MRRLLPLLILLALAPAAQAATPRPDIAAPEAIVIDAQTGDVAYSKDADTRRPIASTTKLMTALLTLEHGDLSDVITAPAYHGLVGESIAGLVRGEKITEKDLLRALLIISANDAAYTLAIHVGGSVPAFVRMMNRKAQQLGLSNTHYANPIGLDDPQNYSSAHDLATLTQTLRKNRTFRRIVNTETTTLESGIRPRKLTNRNGLVLAYPWVDGVKTGYTSQAGNMLVASGTKRNVHLISVVMDSATKTTRDDESLKLLNYGFTKYHLTRAIVEGDRVGTVPIENRPGAELPVIASRTVRKVTRVHEKYGYDTELPKTVAGPISTGQRIGKMVISLRGEPVATVPLVSSLDIPKASKARRTQDVLTRPWTLIVLGVILVIAALATQRRPPRRTEPA